MRASSRSAIMTRSIRQGTKPKILILGIDGGSWNVLEGLAMGGWMPHLRDLMEEGKRGILKSTIPYITCPAWNSICTGRNPGWIGSFGFVNLEPATHDLRFYSYRRDRYAPELWDMLGEKGLTCGVFNLPVADGPRPINGYMIPGFLAPDDRLPTYPEEVRKELEEAAEDFRIEVRGFSVMEPRKAIRECMEVTHQHYLAMRRLLRERPTDVFMGVFHLPDRVCHLSLNSTGLPLDPEKDDLSRLVAAYFRELDDLLGKLFEEFAADRGLFMLVSDHGFAPCRRGFLLNQWLERMGYLKFRPMKVGWRLGINQRRIASLLDRLGLLKLAMRYTPWALRRMVPEGAEESPLLSIVDILQSKKVDWEKSVAVALPNHGIYLNTEDRPRGTVALNAERDALLEEIRRGLLDFRDPETGFRPVLHVHRRDEIYEGPYLDKAPDLVVEMQEGWNSHAYIHPGESMVVPLKRADHRREGVFLIRTPGLSSAVREEADVEDIVPTVLAYLGLDGRMGLDGKPLL